MEKVRKEIITQIEALQSELKEVCVKSKVCDEIMQHLRTKMVKYETRKAKIHHQIDELKIIVEAWLQQNQDNK